MAKKQMKISEREKNEVTLVLKCADIIKSSIRMAAIMQEAVHMEPQDLCASLVFAVGETFLSNPEVTDEEKKKAVKGFCELLEDYVMNSGKETGS